MIVESKGYMNCIGLFCLVFGFVLSRDGSVEFLDFDNEFRLFYDEFRLVQILQSEDSM